MSRFVVLAVLVAFVAGCPSDKKDQASVEKKAGATTVKADSPEGKVRVKASDKATTVEAGGTKVEVDEKTGTVKVNAPGAIACGKNPLVHGSKGCCVENKDIFLTTINNI